MKRIALFTLVLLFAGVTVAAPIEVDLKNTPAKVKFLAVGNPSAVKIEGTHEEEKPLDGKLVLDGNKVTGEAGFPLSQWKTGLSLRDKHMKENYLEVDKHPKATLKVTSLTLPPSGKGNVPFEGKLKLHGVEKPVKGTVEVEKEAKELDLEFKFPVATNDFEIKTPSFMGITVGNDVTVTVDLDATTP